MKLIVAVNNLGVIGHDDQMLWWCREDLQHFKKMTLGCKLLVGSRTERGLPPLKDRELIIVSNRIRGGNYYSLEDALKQKPDWVIGGGEIYRQTVHLCDELHVSIINDNSMGNVRFDIPPDYSGKIVKYYFEPNKPLNI